MMTINELLRTLRLVRPDARVYFAFAACVPTKVASWRGVYAEPALGWAPAGYSGNVTEYPTAASVIADLEAAIDGRTFGGWKGGDYAYKGTAVLHIDNPGDYTNTEITRVEIRGDGEPWHEVVLHTATEGA